jgi:hypothetical protein
MTVTEIHAERNWVLEVVADDGRRGRLDIKPYLADEAFEALRDPREFVRVSNGGYFVEWACGADLSADTIEAKWQVEVRKASRPRANKSLLPTCEYARGKA